MIEFVYPHTQLVAGVDEVGRGPLVGAVVTAAVILDPARPIAGLNDSKKLSEKRRLALCEEPLMADGAGGYVYNLAGAPEDTRVLREFVEKMRERCGGKGRLVFGVRPPNAEGVVSLDPDISKICRVSGWTPQVRFEEGIDRIIGKT